jgi:hypothetical protein
LKLTSPLILRSNSESDDENTDDQQPSTSTGRGGARGRPKVAFSEGSSRIKRRRAAELSQKFEAEELTLAAKKGLKQEGNPSAVTLISEAVFATPARPQRMLKVWDSSRKTQSVVPLTPDQALSLMMETKESKHLYLIYRATAKNQFADIYPSYHKIRDAKSRWAYGSWTTLPVFSKYFEGYGIKCIYGLDHGT